MPDSEEPTSGSHLATEAEPSVGDNIVKVIQKWVAIAFTSDRLGESLLHCMQHSKGWGKVPKFRNLVPFERSLRNEYLYQGFRRLIPRSCTACLTLAGKLLLPLSPPHPSFHSSSLLSQEGRGGEWGSSSFPASVRQAAAARNQPPETLNSTMYSINQL